MPFEFFVVPLHNTDEAKRELNSFISRHRVLSVDRRWVEQGSASFWCFCIDYLDAAPGAPTSAARFASAKGRIDYREILKPEEFAVFAKLRDVRKEIAQSEGVPVYAIFTNEQLARMVQERATNQTALEKIGGVGNARFDKHGGRMLEVLSSAWNGSHEESRPPV